MHCNAHACVERIQRQSAPRLVLLALLPLQNCVPPLHHVLLLASSSCRSLLSPLPSPCPKYPSHAAAHPTLSTLTTCVRPLPSTSQTRIALKSDDTTHVLYSFIATRCSCPECPDRAWHVAQDPHAHHSPSPTREPLYQTIQMPPAVHPRSSQHSTPHSCSVPLSTSYARTVLSSEPETAYLSVALSVTQFISRECPTIAFLTCRPLSTSHPRTVLSYDPETPRLLSSFIATLRTQSSWPGNTSVIFPISPRSHTRILPSRKPEIALLPSSLTPKRITPHFVPPIPSPTCCPVSTSILRIDPSPHPATAVFPSPLIPTLSTCAPFSSTPFSNSFCVLVFHNFTVLSAPPDTTCLPSSLIATLETPPLSPVTRPIRLPFSASHNSKCSFA
ncbi:unnamed protein product [Chondrus crispus]|uniref:Uncharacterized protein n=1 Tax=Chondrus crispus TaxID=2769 RepID=R7Q5N4_CHOCR|nr:unnamed protein product [Chondrus crispus]CDF33329.1 unnamed protein product [Chondrus crispus]|eukprot:XP_005713132.1 unnamed protein product [Chondrus crispus]